MVEIPHGLWVIRLYFQEDNAFGTEVLTALLESASMSVSVATDGQYAVEQYTAEVRDLLSC